MTALLTEILESIVVDLEALLESWIVALKAEKKAPATIKSYRAGVTAYLTWCQRNDHPATIARRQAAAWIAAMLEAGSEASTAMSRQLALKRFSAWLLEEDEQTTDPLLGVKPPKLAEKVLEPLTDDELLALFAACEGKRFIDRRDMAMIRIMAETSARGGEVVGMTHPDDINLAGGLVIVRKAKGGRGRIAGIGPKTSQAIDRYLRIRRTHALAALPDLWLGERGMPLRYSGFWEALGRRAKIARIDRFHPHLLRHTSATRWLAAGGSEGGLMAQAGWTQRSMLDRYTRATAAARAAEESKRLGLGDL
jgi:integrase/recombinase XerD